MIIYIDLLLLINFVLDFLILYSIKKILKRNTSIKRIIIGSLFGELTIILLFLPINIISLILSKFLISILILIITFKYKNYDYFKNNLFYFYIFSIILGGVLYIVKLNIKNYYYIFFIIPFIFKNIVKKINNYKININLKHNIDIYIDNKKYSLMGYIDTGNRLKDQYKNRSIILVNCKDLEFDYNNSILVPYKTLNNNGVIKCIKPDKIIIDNNREIKNTLIGESIDKFLIDDVDAILPNVFNEYYID